MSRQTTYAGPERRKAPRQRTLLSGTVRELNKTATWSCTVRNLGADGARLELANSSWLPNQFDLDIASRDMRELARVVWRQVDTVGVIFRPEERRSFRALNDRVINLAAERDRLRRRVTDLSG